MLRSLRFFDFRVFGVRRLVSFRHWDETIGRSSFLTGTKNDGRP
jgi:hypothetical protein